MGCRIDFCSSEFDIVHIHPNNIAQSIPFSKYSLPHALEITFHRRNRRKVDPVKLSEFEHEQDSETVMNLKKVILDNQLFT